MLQYLGAVSDSLTAAYNAVRPEIQSGALPPKAGTSQNIPNPSLSSSLVDAARSLLSLAASSLARGRLIAAAQPAETLTKQLQQLVSAVEAGPLATAGQQLASFGSTLLITDMTAHGVAAARTASAALAAAHEAVAVEALVAVASLRLQEVGACASPALHTHNLLSHSPSTAVLIQSSILAAIGIADFLFTCN